MFEASDDLRRFGAEILVAQPELVEAARYLVGPPLSQDNLDNLAGAHTNRKALDQELAQRVAQVIGDSLDPWRYPWLAANRAATACEREGSVPAVV